MTTSPYSQDLRKKVIAFLNNGNNKTETAIVFKLNRKTVANWYSRYKNEGHYLPRKRLGAKSQITKDDFLSYVNNNPNSTSEDIGKAFSLGASGARYWLRKFGYSYKKKPLPMWKLLKKNEKNIKK
jgi:transposase